VSNLDPEPYRCGEQAGLRHWPETAHLCDDPIFEPREGFEQDATAYLPRSSDAGAS
jgi:hypothetical protein